MILALCGQKGGAGKTTIATNVIAELLARGRRVLLVDADVQSCARTWADKAGRAGLASPVIALVDGIPIDPTDPYDARAVVQWIARTLPEHVPDFDDVVIDCPGTLAGGVQSAALRIADLALVPAAEDAFSAWSLAATAELVRIEQGRRPGLRAVALIAGVDMRRAIAKQTREHIANAGLEALRTEVLDRTEYVEAAGFLLGVTTYKPRSEAAAEIRSLVDELQAIWRRDAKASAQRSAGNAPEASGAISPRRGKAQARQALGNRA
jgi:chromosome partitioning protein